MSKLWHDVKAVQLQASEWKLPKLRQILIFAMIGLTAGLCVQGLLLDKQSQLLTKSQLSVREAEAILTSGAGPEIMLAAAEALNLSDAGAPETAVSLVRSSLALQPHQPFAWAELAFYQTRMKGYLDETALYALQTSVEQCGYCDQELLRWRLSFAIDNWDSIPEPVRLDIFRGAEFLRWWHIDGAFLAEARQRATALGIDFKHYQRQVVSNVRPHEIGPLD